MAITGFQILEAAEKYTGVPYFEGNPQGTPAEGMKGFDCSGIVQRAMHDLGVEISRTTSTQLADAVANGKVVGTDKNSAQVGDIIHYVGHEEIWATIPGEKGPRDVFSEAIPGTAAGLREETKWPVIGIVRYADSGVGSPRQQTGGDPGKVSGQLVDIIPGISNVVDAVKKIWGIITGFADFINAVTNPNFWQRVALAFLGVLLFMLGLYGIMHKANVITVTSAMVKKGADIASQS